MLDGSGSEFFTASLTDFKILSPRSLLLPDKGTTSPILILLFADALEIKNIINNSNVKNLIIYFILLLIL